MLQLCLKYLLLYTRDCLILASDSNLLVFTLCTTSWFYVLINPRPVVTDRRVDSGHPFLTAVDWSV